MSQLDNLSLPDQILTRLHALAAETGRTAQEHVVAALERHLEQHQLGPVEERILERVRCGENFNYRLQPPRRVTRQ